MLFCKIDCCKIDCCMVGGCNGLCVVCWLMVYRKCDRWVGMDVFVVFDAIDIGQVGKYRIVVMCGTG